MPRGRGSGSPPDRSAAGSPKVRVGPVGQDDRQPSDLGSARRRPGPPARPGAPAGNRATRGGTGRGEGPARAAHRATSRCRRNRAPRSHSRSACQWMRAIVRWGRNGWRRSSRGQVPVGQRPPGQVQARVELEALGLVLVDRDAQPRRLVADPDLVAATHLDERRDVERLVHRGHERRRAVRRAGGACTGGARRACCGPRPRRPAGRRPRSRHRKKLAGSKT